jgi:hypothetical protein
LNGRKTVTSISRRKVLSIVAAGAGGLVAKASGLMPEIALAGETTSSGMTSTTEGNIVIEHFDQPAIGRAIGAARADAQGRLLWAALETDGMRPQMNFAYGARAHIKTDPQLAGHYVAVPFSDRRGRSAKLYYGLEAQGGLKSFITRWNDDDQKAVEVFDVQAGVARRRSRVLIGIDEATIDFAGGARHVIHTTGAGRPPGFAAPSAECNAQGVVCAVVCGTVVGFGCWYESTVVCVGLGILCPPCGAVCEVISVIMCGIVASTSCYYVCRPCG